MLFFSGQNICFITLKNKEFIQYRTTCLKLEGKSENLKILPLKLFAAISLSNNQVSLPRLCQLFKNPGAILAPLQSVKVKIRACVRFLAVPFKC